MENKVLDLAVKLSYLELTQEQKTSVLSELNTRALPFAQQLLNCDTSGITLKKNAVSFDDLRVDKPCPSISQDEALKNTTHKELNCFAVPKE